MKKAPDKIYIPIRFKDTGRLVPTWWQEPIEGFTNIEYIRKDALLEWAKAKHMELDPPQNERDFGRIEAVEELIKHIESL